MAGTNLFDSPPMYSDMLKYILVATALAAFSVSFGVDPQQNKDDKSVHHAAVHAEHWVDHHVSAPHKKVVKRKPMHKKPSKTVHHAVMHAEHWVDHHVSAPHKTSGGN